MKKTILVLFSVICIFSVLVFVVFNFVMFPKKYKAFIEKYSACYNLDTAIVYAIANVESDFDEKAVSSAGAMGVMQLMPATAEWIAGELGEEYDEKMLFDAETNIWYGCFYLRYLLDKFGDVWVVVAAYNAGEGVVREWIAEDGSLNEDAIGYGETKRYVSKVRRCYRAYKNAEFAM